MRRWYAGVTLAALVALAPAATRAQDYDGCNEQFYDSNEEPCGGGHQHSAGKRDETSLERSRHRHRYLEDQIHELNKKVAALSTEVEQLKKAPATK